MPSAHPYGPSINHLVLTVRDIEASHKFYTEVIGFTRNGELSGPHAGSTMWFYQGHPDSHHDLALVQAKGAVEPAQPWAGFFPDGDAGINHVAIGYPTRDERLARI